jgi:hypothetical protein
MRHFSARGHRRKSHLIQTMKTLPYMSFVFLLALLISTASCIPIAPSDVFPLIVASPTARSCSLEEVTSRVINITPSITKQPLDFTGISWSKYEDTHFGYSFEYPAAYDKPSKQDCVLHVGSRGNEGQEVYVGSGAAIYIRQVQRASWRDDACLNILDISNDSQLTMLNEIAFAGEDALVVAFTATWNPNGSLIQFQHDGYFYVIENIANTKCNIEGTKIEENVVYQHMLDSFRFQSQ